MSGFITAVLKFHLKMVKVLKEDGMTKNVYEYAKQYS